MSSHRPFFRNTPWPVKGLFFVSLIAVVVLLLGGVVMLLWNAILPPVTGVQPLSYWQGVGLLVLSRILFGGFRGKGPGKPFGRNRSKWRDKWASMNEEDRARLRQKWQERCGPRKKPSTGDQAS